MSTVREELRQALLRGIRQYGDLAVGLALIGCPATVYLVIVGVAATTAVPTMVALLGLIFSAVLSHRRRRAGATLPSLRADDDRPTGFHRRASSPEGREARPSAAPPAGT